MIKSKWLAISGMSALCVGTIWVTSVPAQEPSTALFCRGPLTTLRSDGGKTVKTRFKWAKEAAGKANPGAGECAWADRIPEPAEIKQGPDNAITGNLGPFDTLPVGTYGKLCITKANDALVVRSVIRGDGQNAPFVLPPFTNEGCPT
jgi:hypothetical protein